MHSARALAPRLPPISGRTVEVALEPGVRRRTLPAFGGRQLDMWTYGEAWPFVVRARAGDRLKATVNNRLGQHTAIHWHGIRIVNGMDGVSYLTQLPIQPGASFTYDFLLPDAGTFFFHDHCDTVTSFGHGLIGVLIVEGDETKPYDADIVLAAKDWRIGPDGAFLPFTSNEGASKGGTFGTVRTTNGALSPEIEVPASADVRVRVLNVDPSRVMEIGVEGGEAAVIAVDGHAVPPFPLEGWRMGPAMRVDLAVRTAADGGTVSVLDAYSAETVALAQLKSTGAAKRKGAFDPAPLRRPIFPEPELANAEARSFVFSATAVNEEIPLPSGEVVRFADSLCLTDATFWAINKASWPMKDMKRLPPPLAVLERGKTYRLTLQNVTPVIHTIHVHGLVMKVLGSSKRARPEHWADTVLLTPKERLEVALVADNPGDWMFHCHILEHQETGMMGLIRIA